MFLLCNFKGSDFIVIYLKSFFVLFGCFFIFNFFLGRCKFCECEFNDINKSESMWLILCNKVSKIYVVLFYYLWCMFVFCVFDRRGINCDGV